jgi:hypothetical protein
MEEELKAIFLKPVSDWTQKDRNLIQGAHNKLGRDRVKSIRDEDVKPQPFEIIEEEEEDVNTEDNGGTDLG